MATGEPTAVGEPTPAPDEMRVLLLPPTARDAEAMREVLAGAGVACVACPGMNALCAELARGGAGAVVVSEEALVAGTDGLATCVCGQPVWSDLPVILIARPGKESAALGAALARVGNVSVIERPVRVTTLVSVVQSALRGRRRQYEVREHLAARERAAADLRHSREQVEVVVKGANVGVWYCPLPFDRLIWDETVKAHFHLPPDAEVTIDVFYDRIHPDDRDRTRRTIEASIAGRTPYDIDYRTVSPDGSRVTWVRASGRGFYDAAGEPVRFDGITIDVTDRAMVDAALREARSRSESALMAGEVGTYYWDIAADVLTGDANFAALFGVRGDDGRGRAPLGAYVTAMHADDRARVGDAIRRTLDTGEAYRAEYRIVHESGERWVLARGVIDGRDSGGAPTGWAGVVVDITDRKRAEEERGAMLERERSARAEAERASQMKDEFLATLSHELRTPLNAIVGWSQIIKGNLADPADVAEGIEIIERNARAQTQIIEDLLDMSRIISGKVRLDVQRIDLAGVLRSSVETVRPAADAKGVRVQAVIDPLAGPVSGDANRLQQVFWNLLTNAVKFTPRDGRVQLLLERVNSHLEVSVIDTGEGIAPEFLPFVFDRFRQADASTTRRHGGLGLGLAIVRQLVELHGGTVRAKSAGPGRGSTFIVTLPVTVLHPGPPEEPVAERRHPTAGGAAVNADACADVAGVRVLVVDDEPDSRALVKRLLEDCDAVVTTAASAREAFERLKADRPQVLVSDIGMPGEDGFALIGRVRALPADQGGRTPAIALTAYARAEDRVKVVIAGFQHHVAKPVEPAELIAIIASLVRG